MDRNEIAETVKYLVGIGGSPKDQMIECDTFDEAINKCADMAIEQAEHEGINIGSLASWGEDDPDLGAGVCPLNNDGGYWPNVHWIS